MECVDCPICRGVTTGKPAAIAPFLAAYCGFEQASTETRHCKTCDFVFFKRRLTDAEAARLYTNYRGDEYNKVRLSFEPQYAPMKEYFDNPLSHYYIDRARDYVDVLDIFPELDSVDTILDFGGDGSLPARLFPNAKVAIDDLSAGSTDTLSSRYELIFTSNVFEHVSDPVALLRQIVNKLLPEGILMIDVPSPAQPNLSEGLLWQEHYGGELFVMHEHINHFSKRSLRLLVAAAGLDVFFEAKLRQHGALIALAASPESEVAKRLVLEKAQRALLFETRMARAEARASQDAASAVAQRMSAGHVAIKPGLADRSFLYRAKRAILSEHLIKMLSINGVRKLVRGTNARPQRAGW